MVCRVWIEQTSLVFQTSVSTSFTIDTNSPNHYRRLATTTISKTVAGKNSFIAFLPWHSFYFRLTRVSLGSGSDYPGPRTFVEVERVSECLGRGIRTLGLRIPSPALYQAKLHPVTRLALPPNWRLSCEKVNSQYRVLASYGFIIQR